MIDRPILILLVIATLSGASMPAAAQQTPAGDAWARVDSLAARTVRDQGLPGMALAITDGGAVLHEAYVGKADLKTGRLVTSRARGGAAFPLRGGRWVRAGNGPGPGRLRQTDFEPRRGTARPSNH